MSFYIKELTITGEGKEPATIKFEKGFNIVVGPSNTGKTLIFKCVDYILGAKECPLIEGYNQISLTVVFENSEIKLMRYCGGKNLTVYSSSSEIQSGEYNYSTGKDDYEKSFNSVLLKLIDINEHHDIIKNKSYEKKSLTWRIFSDAFFIDETRMISERSILLPEQATEKTSFLSALIFLLIGDGFSSVNPSEAKNIRKAKESAVKEYIYNELRELSEKKNLLYNDLQEKDDLESIIDSLSVDIETVEKNIVDKINDNKNLLRQIQEKNEELSKANILLNRYDFLESQYDSDLKRLNFIVDGEINYKQTEEVECPFCKTIVSITNKQDYISASLKEYQIIKLQKSDLNDARNSLELRITDLTKSLNLLLNDKKDVEYEIDTVLKPKLSDLKSRLQTYKEQIKNRNEIELITVLCSQKSKFLNEQENKKEDENKYDPKEYLDLSFTTCLGEYIHDLLIKSHFENLNSVVFSNKSMDFSVNGKDKRQNGKGYKAYYNSILAIAFTKYLFEHGTHKPNLLFLDSPVLSLKLNENEEIQASIKRGLFEVLRDMTDDIQIIVFENKVPEIDYKSTNIIKFTKDKDNGRYGFIPDVYN